MKLTAATCDSLIRVLRNCASEADTRKVAASFSRGTLIDVLEHLTGLKWSEHLSVDTHEKTIDVLISSLAETRERVVATPIPTRAPWEGCARFGLMQESGPRFSIALLGDNTRTDALWVEIRKAGEPWPSLFRAYWTHKSHAEAALAAARGRFFPTDTAATVPAASSVPDLRIEVGRAFRLKGGFRASITKVTDTHVFWSTAMSVITGSADIGMFRDDLQRGVAVWVD